MIALLFAALIAASFAAPSPYNIFETDITPEEAQKFLNSPPFSEPQLAGRTAVLPLVRYNDPRFRTAEAGPTLGHYWKNGREIENTEDYVEEVYDAQQYHGQDGLGAYGYGYKTAESSKVENRARTGDVVGSYTYKNGNNEDIKVRYWADSEGFHQEDNLPKVVLQPVQEADDVRQARLAHEKAWQEAAAAAAQDNLQGEPDNYQGSASEPQGQFVAQQQQAQLQHQQAQAGQNYQTNQQAQASERIANYAQPQTYQQQGQARESKAYFNQAQSSYQSNQQANPQSYSSNYASSRQAQQEEVEPTGPPKGFFYSFNYPVSSIQAKNADQAGPVNPGRPYDEDTVQINDYQRQG